MRTEARGSTRDFGRPRAAIPTLVLAVATIAWTISPVHAQDSLFPSPLTDTCLFEERDFSPTTDISVEGTVRDESHDVLVPGARVDARWTEEGEDREAEAWTDPDGRFRFCRIPEGAEVRLSPEVGGGPGPAVRAESGQGAVVALVVPLPSPEEHSGLLGTVTESDSDRGVADAEIRIPELDLFARSHGDGSFVFERVEPGSYRLDISHVSYGMVSDTVHLVAGRPLQMQFDVAPDPIRISGVEAIARPRRWLSERASVLRRMRQGHGAYITREDIALLNEPPLHRLFSTVPGVRSDFVSHPWGNTYYPVVGSCGAPAMFVDGARIVIEPARGVGINEFLSSNIELIEIYRGSASAPAQYSGMGAGCGVILVWTIPPGSR